MNICRDIAIISAEMEKWMRNRGHFKDEKKVYELLIRVFRSPELIVKLTEMHPGSRSVRKILNREEE